jgi:hypothetical protein
VVIVTSGASRVYTDCAGQEVLSEVLGSEVLSEVLLEGLDLVLSESSESSPPRTLKPAAAEPPRAEPPKAETLAAAKKVRNRNFICLEFWVLEVS